MSFHALPLGRSAAFVCAVSLFACSSSSSDGTPVDAVDGSSATTPEPPAAAEPDAGVPSAPSCAKPPSKGVCSESAWVRGVAHFDPAKLTGKGKPILRVVLRHGFIMVKGEEMIGGRLHAWVSVPVTDPSKGEVPFALDMCDLGTSMWSEENGAFHVVLILDENGDNDLDMAASQTEAIAVGTPSMGELVKMVDVDLSCNAPSPCLDVKLDCTGGAACTTIQPMKSCTKKTPGCGSDSSFCK